jgi:UDP-glucose 4-epimerase
LLVGRKGKVFEWFANAPTHKDAIGKMASWPVLRSVLPRILAARGNNFTVIPVNEGIELEGGIAMPISVAEYFIDRAMHHVILDFCPCRRSFHCREFPVNHGCLFIGEGAREIDPGVGKHVGKEEALDHLHKGAKMGLLTVIGRLDFDAVMLGVKQCRRLMTICQCCPCCCLTTAFPHAPRGLRDIVVPLEGLEVRLTEDCTGCGACVEACIFQQVRLVEGKAVMGEECKKCGRCASVCPVGAIKITIENPFYIEACIERISAIVDVK